MTVLLLKSQKFDKICLSGKVKPNKNTVDRSELILKRNTKFSNQKSTTKPQCMIPFQKGMGEMSDKQKKLILTSLQFCKNYQCPLRRVAVRFSDTLPEQFSG